MPFQRHSLPEFLTVPDLQALGFDVGTPADVERQFPHAITYTMNGESAWALADVFPGEELEEPDL